MLEKVQAVIAEVAGKFGDSRVDYFVVSAEITPTQTIKISGTVLDAETRDYLITQLTAHFPETQFAFAVTILRHPAVKTMTVTTNLASVQREPSRRMETITQLVNGQQVEVLREDGEWVFTRQPDGYLGWVLKAYLAIIAPLEPTHIVTEPIGLLRVAPTAAAELVSRVLGGTCVSVVATDADWVQLVLAGEQAGWLPAANLRALASLPEDQVGRRAQIAQDAPRLVGVPYRWGGCSAMGIDCSGFAQLLHKWVGVTIPRDADMQFAAGEGVADDFAVGDLLFFGRKTTSKRTVTHVAVSLGGWKIIHSSGSLNGVYVDDVQSNQWLRENFLGARSFV